MLCVRRSIGKFVFVANYGSGSVSAFALGSGGELQSRTSNIQHAGKSVDPGRQEGPHAHCIMTDPTNKYVCAVDLGLDQVVIYSLDGASGTLTSTNNPFKASPGFGPRHLAFHPNGNMLLSFTKWHRSCLPALGMQPQVP